jgi:N-methylhydantoinase A
MQGNVRVAVDIGGTFTDIQVLHEMSGKTFSLKTPTTPDDPSRGLVIGVTEAARRFGFDPAQIGMLMHGTTIATNAVLERKLPRGALITTQGFEDVLEIGRHVRRDIYSAVAESRALLIPRARRFGVSERIQANGNIDVALDDAAVISLATQIGELDVDAVAVCLLHAYANPVHEQRVCKHLRQMLPDVRICASHDVSPELREFERTSTTVLNALLMPVVGRYLEQLEQRLGEAGFKGQLYLFQSNGGVMRPARAAEQPVRLLLSGPAGGALAAETIGRQHAMDAVVGIDMGGTSFDVCVVDRGGVREIAQASVAGLPVRVPMSEIRTISAGGGSIARVLASGELKVGPDSAGAIPGPACYGHGGEWATVTDANVVLGRLDPARFMNGELSVDLDAARTALHNAVGKPLKATVEEAAEGVLRVAVVQMAAAIRLSLFEKGLDPRDFALISFGGAGGLHAAEVAEELGSTRVLYPTDSATLSAWGMLHADVVHDRAVTRAWQTSDGVTRDIAAAVEQLVDDTRRQLASEGFNEDQVEVVLLGDMRYPGQAYEIPVPWPTPAITDANLQAAICGFHDAHETQFAHAERSVAPEVLTWRTRATARLPRVERADEAPRVHSDTPFEEQRNITLGGSAQSVPVVNRAALSLQVPRPGPMVLEDGQTTTFIPAGWVGRLLADGSFEATRMENQP